MAAYSPLLDVLAEVPDPCRAEGKLYSLSHVLLFAILAIVSGCNSYRGFQLVAGFSTRGNVAKSRCCPRFSAGVAAPGGDNQLPKVVQGVTFTNGVDVTLAPKQTAA